MTAIAAEIQNALAALARPNADLKAKFFKAGPGEYAEGDEFFNVEVPKQRLIARQFAGQTTLDDLADLLDSPWHECRLTALLILVSKANKAQRIDLEPIVRFYERRFPRVNNWDLVDSSAPQILGPWYLETDRSVLFQWAKSDHLWTVRIAVMTTQHFVRNRDFATTFALAEALLGHGHDLIHKAVGWMLREIGKRDFDAECAFLRRFYRSMPRTMLRYAIEKFPRDLYSRFLRGDVD